jgi:hypothetical protein
MSVQTATIEHPITKHCPILTGGDLTPQTILLAENAFNKFFIAKNVKKADQVKLILGTFKDAHIHNWISTNRERLLKLSFKEFITELRTNFLPTGWVNTICISLLGKTMSQNTKFWDYAQEV